MVRLLPAPESSPELPSHSSLSPTLGLLSKLNPEVKAFSQLENALSQQFNSSEPQIVATCEAFVDVTI